MTRALCHTVPGFMDDEKARSEFGFHVIIECLVVDYLGIVVGVGHLVEEDVVNSGVYGRWQGTGWHSWCPHSPLPWLLCSEVMSLV